MRFLLLIISLCIFANPATAQEETLDFTTFKTLPILHDGRIKPMESFAKAQIKQLSGKEQLDNLTAPHWLALTLFDPQNAIAVPVFKISENHLRKKLQLDESKKLFSFAELQPGLQNTQKDVMALLQKQPEDLTGDEQSLLQIHENAAALTNLMRSFSAFLPLDITLPKSYMDLLQSELNFSELAKIEQKLAQNTAKIVAEKGQDPTAYTPEELSIAKAAFTIQTLRTAGQNNTLLRVIPSTWEQAKGEWFSPWQVLLQGQGSPESAFLLSQWTDLAAAYRTQNAQLWATISNDILEETKLQSADNEAIDTARFKTEQAYSHSKPYLWIIGLYALALLAALIAFKKFRDKRA